MDNILSQTRNLVQDLLQNGSDIYTYANSATFNISEPNVQSVTEVWVNDRISGFSHLFNSTTKKVTLVGSFSAGDIIQIDYTYYANYSDTEIKAYVQSALVHLSVNNYGLFTYNSVTDTIYPTPDSKEEYLISAITAILISPDNFSLRLPDISINRASDVSTMDKIRKVIASAKKDSHGIFQILDKNIT